MRRIRDTLALGFSLLELMVVVSIFGILLALGLPAFQEWMTNSRLRNQAEYAMSGLQLARGEALKRNAIVRFQLVSDMTNACTVVPTSNLWMVSHGNPAANCGNAESLQNPDTTGNNPNSAAPVLLLKGRQEQVTTAQTTLGVANGDAVAPHLCFSGGGQLARVDGAGLCTAAMNPATTLAPTAIMDITDPTAGVCFTDTTDPPTGTIRCLRVRVSSWGEIRMCDPGLDALKHPTDPRVCI